MNKNLDLYLMSFSQLKLELSKCKNQPVKELVIRRIMKDKLIEYHDKKKKKIMKKANENINTPTINKKKMNKDTIINFDEVIGSLVDSDDYDGHILNNKSVPCKEQNKLDHIA